MALPEPDPAQTPETIESAQPDTAVIEAADGSEQAEPAVDAPAAEETGDAEAAGQAPNGSAAEDSVSAEDFMPDEATARTEPVPDAELKAVLEAIVYITDEPLTLDQICAAMEQPRERVMDLLDQLAADCDQPHRGLTIREVAGGYKMATKPEHHDAVRRFVKNLNPPLKLSLPALETLAVIAYKQPITAPEIMEIRGVQGAGVLKTLVDRRLIATAGRKQVVGKPILYKTTREFLVQFGLRDLGELPTLKEFQDLARMDTESAAAEPEKKPEAETPLFPADTGVANAEEKAE